MRYILNTDFIKSILNAFPFISGYALVSSYIYTVIYWYQFDIEPFLFIGINDLLQQTIKVLVLIALSAISFSFIEIYFSHTDKEECIKNDKSDILTISAPFILIFLLFVTLSFWWSQFIFFAIGSIVPYISHLSKSNTMQTNIKNKNFRMLITAIVITFPSYSVSFALMDARNIKEANSSQTYLTFQSDDCSSRCILIGKLGNNFVYQNNKNRVRFVNTDTLDFFEINKKSK